MDADNQNTGTRARNWHWHGACKGAPPPDTPRRWYPTRRLKQQARKAAYEVVMQGVTQVDQVAAIIQESLADVYEREARAALEDIGELRNQADYIERIRAAAIATDRMLTLRGQANQILGIAKEPEALDDDTILAMAGEITARRAIEAKQVIDTRFVEPAQDAQDAVE